MYARLVVSAAAAIAAGDGQAESLQAIANEYRQSYGHNGGRHRTAAQDKRRAAKRRSVRRAKRLGHH